MTDNELLQSILDTLKRIDERQAQDRISIEEANESIKTMVREMIQEQIEALDKRREEQRFREMQENSLQHPKQ